MRVHDAENQQIIANSFREFGAARSIVMDADGIIRAGNGSVQGAAEAGVKTARIIETDGTELIVVKRTDLSGDRAKAYALADNKATDTSAFDDAAIESALRELDEAGIDMTDFGFAEVSDAEVMADAIEELQPRKFEKVWVLIGAPLSRYGEMASLVEQLSHMGEDITVEMTVAGGDDADAKEDRQ